MKATWLEGTGMWRSYGCPRTPKGAMIYNRVKGLHQISPACVNREWSHMSWCHGLHHSQKCWPICGGRVASFAFSFFARLVDISCHCSGDQSVSNSQGWFSIQGLHSTHRECGSTNFRKCLQDVHLGRTGFSSGVTEPLPSEWAATRVIHEYKSTNVSVFSRAHFLFLSFLG